MTLIDTEDKQQFLRLLDSEFESKLPADQARQMSTFAQAFFETIPLEEIRSRRVSDVYSAIIASWQFVQEHQPDQPKVRVFNPTLDNHGWQSTHTVVVVLHPNIPFLMDSVRMALNRQDLTVHTILHGILCVERDAQGKLNNLLQNCTGTNPLQAEALLYFEVDRHSDQADLDALRAALEAVLAEVRVAVRDYEPMRQRVGAVIETLTRAPGQPDETLAEGVEFLRWMADNHFTFLGYEEYEAVGAGEGMQLRLLPESRLGILRRRNERPEQVALGHLPLKARHKLLEPGPLIFAKSPERSRIHRPAYPDLV